MCALSAPALAKGRTSDAEGLALAKSSNCLACHAVAVRVVGPSFKEVAAKYATNPKAVETLAKKVRDGGFGVWGAIPMPANLQLNEDTATQLVKWVLTQKGASAK